MLQTTVDACHMLYVIRPALMGVQWVLQHRAHSFEGPAFYRYVHGGLVVVKGGPFEARSPDRSERSFHEVCES